MALSHKLNILKRLFTTNEHLTATDFSYISNANQYFVELEQQGLIKSENGYKGKTRVKLRFIPDEYRKKVYEYLVTHKAYEVKSRN